MGKEGYSDVVAIILAAGKNTRMKSNIPKAMQKIAGKPMLGMVLDTVKRVGIKRCVVVVGFGANHIARYLADHYGNDVECAYQNKLLGTGHALLTGLEYLNDPGAYAIPRDVFTASNVSAIPTCEIGTAEAMLGADVTEMIDDTYAADDTDDTDMIDAAGDADAAGAAGAMLGARFGGQVLALYGDMPFVSSGTLAGLIAQNRSNGEHGTLGYASLPDPSSYGFGRIIRDEHGDFVNIVEQKDATIEEAQISESNIGVYCFEAETTRNALKRLRTDNLQGEMYLTDVFAELMKAGGRVGIHEVADIGECLGANDRVALAEMNRVMRLDKCSRLMLESGVSIVDPGATYIDQDVMIGMDTIILPGCVIEGRTMIGSACEIGPNARIRDAIVGDRSKIQYSVVAETAVGCDVSIGPFANLRPGSEVGAGTKIGDFVEVKNANIGENVAISHLAYIGDADVGSSVNIGCGAITCNYDGKTKYRTTIGSHAFIGSNVNLIAPVTVNKNAYIASGSTITDEVPEDALAIARERQVIKEHWVTRKGLRRDGKGDDV